MAQVALEAKLDARGIPAAAASAGFLESGRESPPEVFAALEGIGLHLSEHLSRRVSQVDLARADLILGMERVHVQQAVVIEPTSWPRAFTLKELVRRGSAATRQPNELVEHWMARVHLGREIANYLRSSEDDDLEDPFGGPRSGYSRAAAEIDRLVSSIASLLWPTYVPEVVDSGNHCPSRRARLRWWTK